MTDLADNEVFFTMLQDAGATIVVMLVQEPRACELEIELWARTSGPSHSGSRRRSRWSADRGRDRVTAGGPSTVLQACDHGEAIYRPSRGGSAGAVFIV